MRAWRSTAGSAACGGRCCCCCRLGSETRAGCWRCAAADTLTPAQPPQHTQHTVHTYRNTHTTRSDYEALKIPQATRVAGVTTGIADVYFSSTALDKKLAGGVWRFNYRPAAPLYDPDLRSNVSAQIDRGFARRLTGCLPKGVTKGSDLRPKLKSHSRGTPPFNQIIIKRMRCEVQPPAPHTQATHNTHISKTHNEHTGHHHLDP